MDVITGENKVILSWATDLEEQALAQAKNLADLPFVCMHIALMPDCHMGYGMPIGGVMATKDVVVPNAVGVDIGCGMIATRTSLTNICQENIKKIMGGSKEYQGGIRTKIPVGFNRHSKKQDINLMPFVDNLVYNFNTHGYDSIVQENYESALKQLGTLGGGNHFIELQKGDDGYIWIMVHSGSRNLGYKVANHYNDLAIALNEKWFSSVPKKWELAFLPLDSDEGQNYLNEMNYCVDFAQASRDLMMSNVCKSIDDIISGVTYGDPINIAHNYAVMENHFSHNVMIHRKGATRAYEGELGIIPGSQGTSSYIVRGKGHIKSFKSCSHGAGRKMGRKQAQKQLNLEQEKKMLNDQGIIHSIRNKKDLDEASGAYKDIDEVMENQKDLVEIVVKLSPLAVIKG